MDIKSAAICLVLFFAFKSLNAQALDKVDTPHNTPAHAAALELAEPEFDFGSIPQGKPVYHIFFIRNIGSQPLKLENVQPSCGCTTPEWSKEPINPGSKATIKVGYNAASEGSFEKFVTIYFGTEAKQIKIKGSVWKAPSTSAPLNPSIQFLKQQLQ